MICLGVVPINRTYLGITGAHVDDGMVFAVNLHTLAIYTIGFAEKSAEDFFALLKGAGIKILLDIRLNNTSQLSGFTKSKDIAYFVKEIMGGKYLHLPELAPTKELLKKYKDDGNWPNYEREFLAILESRKVENTIDVTLLKGPTVLLCSEINADRCHRRLVAEYLTNKILPDYEIAHL